MMNGDREMERSRWRWMRLLALAIVAALFVAACGEADDGDNGAADDGDAAADGELEGSVTLAVNPWPGSEANTAIAAAILEEQGVDVEVVEIDENAQWSGLAAGDIDAQLEVWTSGHAENIATYVDEAGQVEMPGPLGVVGEIGWFIPSYLLDENPDLDTYEGLDENAELFATAETGDAGQFLAGDPSFVSWDEHIIDNLGLNFEVVQSGSEAALLSELQSAYEREEPLLFYFWTPHWAHEVYDLTMVELPEHDDECAELPEEERDCGYPAEDLEKAFYADLQEENPGVHEFLVNFTLENEDQDQVTAAMEQEGLTAEEAAEQWVEENRDRWEAWLP
jgi:glycine betaine/proline transport system substrate-binding protein